MWGERRLRARVCTCALVSVRTALREYVSVCTCPGIGVCVQAHECVCVWGGVFRCMRVDEYAILATMLADAVTRKPPVAE